MSNYFFAYHGPSNENSFNFQTGYGVTQKSKWDKIKNGDHVYIIQKLSGRETFEFCGLFEVINRYEDHSNRFAFRCELSDISKLSQFIEIDDKEIGDLLPLAVGGSKGWSNFQKHFCRQGVSFEKPISDTVKNVLDSLFVKAQKTQKTALEIFEDEVIKSSTLSQAERMNRINKAPKKPTKKNVSVEVFNRNPDIVAERLLRADGQCENCKNKAPFARKSNGTPYLEVHHKKQLSLGGEDTLENTIALCPNCHRKMHFG